MWWLENRYPSPSMGPWDFLTGFVLTQDWRWAILSGAVGCLHLRSRELLIFPLQWWDTKEASTELEIWWASLLDIGRGSARKTALKNRNWWKWKFPKAGVLRCGQWGSCTQIAISQQPDRVRSSNWECNVPQDMLDPSVSLFWVCNSSLMSCCDC